MSLSPYGMILYLEKSKDSTKILDLINSVVQESKPIYKSHQGPRCSDICKYNFEKISFIIVHYYVQKHCCFYATLYLPSATLLLNTFCHDFGVPQSDSQHLSQSHFFLCQSIYHTNNFLILCMITLVLSVEDISTSSFY